MKRSEMLKKIREKLVGTYMNPDIFERQILDTVEELGMLPPPYEDESIGYNRSEGTYSFTIYQWEEDMDKTGFGGKDYFLP